VAPSPAAARILNSVLVNAFSAFIGFSCWACRFFAAFLPPVNFFLDAVQECQHNHRKQGATAPQPGDSMSSSKHNFIPNTKDRNRATAAIALLQAGPATLASLYDALDIVSPRDRHALRATLKGTTEAKVSTYGTGPSAMACIGEPPPKQKTMAAPSKANEDSHYAKLIKRMAEDCAKTIHAAKKQGFFVNAKELKELCESDTYWRGVKRILKSQGFGIARLGSRMWTVIETKETTND
jgi:hypothetical protein